MAIKRWLQLKLIVPAAPDWNDVIPDKRAKQIPYYSDESRRMNNVESFKILLVSKHRSPSYSFQF